MSLNLLKSGAVAAALVVATISASSAAPYLHGEINQLTKVKSHHSNLSTTLQWAHPGEHVTILNSWGSWYYVQIPGPDGWVKKSAVDVFYGPGPGPGPGPSGPGVNFCFNGPFGYFCVNN